MAEKEKFIETRADLTADMSVRSGVYANGSQARTTAKETVLDFFFIDGESVGEDGIREVSGVLQSRVILSNAALVEMADMLEAHIKQHGLRSE